MRTMTINITCFVTMSSSRKINDDIFTIHIAALRASSKDKHKHDFQIATFCAYIGTILLTIKQIVIGCNYSISIETR
jgi:hypothetical protein